MKTSDRPADARPSFQLSWRWYAFMSAMIFVPAILGLAAIWGLGRLRALRDSATQAMAHPEREFVEHTKYVGSVAITPDGKQGLSLNSDRTLRLWSLATGDCLRTMGGTPSASRASPFCPTEGNASREASRECSSFGILKRENVCGR
jgi:WD40 repeat protein